MRTRRRPFSLWLADRQSHHLPTATTRPQSHPEYIGLRKQPRRIYYTPLHASSLPLRSADALLDLPYFALGRRLAGQSRVPVLLGRLVNRVFIVSSRINWRTPCGSSRYRPHEHRSLQHSPFFENTHGRTPRSRISRFRYPCR
jgi:hypothetical protein